MLSLQVWAAVAHRLARKYPAEYVLAWCDWIDAHLDEVDQPGAYTYRCITSNDWPPLGGVEDVGPRPDPEAAPQPPPAQHRPRRTGRPSSAVNQPSVEERAKRAAERAEAKRVKDHNEALSEAERLDLIESEKRHADPVVAEQAARLSHPRHGMAREALLIDAIRRKLGMEVMSSPSTCSRATASM